MSVAVALISLGCSKNLVDGETMLFSLKKSGYRIVPDPALADAIIVNTCGFIEAAQKESIETVLTAARLKETGRLKALIVTGCLSQMFKEEILKEMPEIDGVLGTADYPLITEALSIALSGEVFSSFSDIGKPLPPSPGRILTTGPRSAFLKIAEGCDNHCSYCVIPSLRGDFRSLPAEEVLRQASELAEAGVKELLLIAQDTTRYGTDLYGEPRIAELLEGLCAISSIRWIRLHYCYPDGITDKLLDVMSRQQKILHYLDIPIQHCAGSVLKRMNRRGDAPSLLSLFGKIRAKMPDICLRTSVMVGFPGETEEDFSALCSFISEVKFDRLGAFSFCPMEGTLAAALPDQVDEDIKANRQRIVMEAQSLISLKKNQSMTGKKLLVLCEEAHGGQYAARSYRDSLEVDPKVLFTSDRDIAPGEFLEVSITSCDEYDLFGHAL